MKIYGSEDENCLIEQFLTRYFAWRAAENAGTEYSLDDTGDYSVRVMYVDN